MVLLVSKFVDSKSDIFDLSSNVFSPFFLPIVLTVAKIRFKKWALHEKV